jgi:excisionase family DNA binding protein
LAFLASEGVITHVTGTGYHHGEQPDHPPRRKRRAAAQRRYETGRSEQEISALLGNPYITVRELARFMRVSKMTVYRAINDGRIPGVVRLSPRMVRLPSAGVRVYIAECSAP